MKIKPVNSIFTILILSILASCQQEFPGTDGNPGKDILVTLSVFIPVSDTSPTTRSVNDKINADGIQTVHLLCFKKGASGDPEEEQLAYVAKGIEQNKTNTYKVNLFQSKAPDDLYWFVVLANIDDNQISGLNPGMTYTQVSTVLYKQLATDGTRLSFSADSPHRMFGIVSEGTGMQVTEGMSLGHIKLIRAVSQVEIGIGTYNMNNGQWELTDTDKYFELSNVEVWAPMKEYFYMPAWGTFDYDTESTVQVNQASGALDQLSATTGTVWRYEGADISTNGKATYCKNVIYLPEAPLKGHTVNEATGRDLHTTIIIGGYFHDPAHPESQNTKTWYRIDFTEAPTTASDSDLFDILRNHLYRFSLTVKARGSDSPQKAWEIPNSNISVHVGVEAWENGGDIVADNQEILLDADLSSLPIGVTMDASGHRIDVSPDGGDMILAFSAASPVQLANVEPPNSSLSITPDGDAEVVGAKMISRYKVHVSKQTIGLVSYSVKLNMKTALQQYSYDQFSINVQEASKILPVVTIGGRTWMAFNTKGKRLEDQVYPADGETVEDTYRHHWAYSLGLLYQFKSNTGSVPWQQPTSGNLPPFEWTDPPCPKGYRVPTNAELSELFPFGKDVSSDTPYTYEYNGETITARVLSGEPQEITFPGTNIKGNTNYISLTSQTGAIIYIPIGGWKGSYSTDADPNTRNGVFFRSKDWSPIGIGWQLKPNGNGWKTGYASIPTSAYGYVRCINEN